MWKQNKNKVIARRNKNILGMLNEWAYIECQTPYIVRGFVDYKALNIKTGL